MTACSCPTSLQELNWRGESLRAHPCSLCQIWHSQVGEHFKTPPTCTCIRTFNCFDLALCTQLQDKAAMEWTNGNAMTTYSPTRWWSKCEHWHQLLVQSGGFELFLQRNVDILMQLPDKSCSLSPKIRKRMHFSRLNLLPLLTGVKHLWRQPVTLRGIGLWRWENSDNCCFHSGGQCYKCTSCCQEHFSCACSSRTKPATCTYICQKLCAAWPGLFSSSGMPGQSSGSWSYHWLPQLVEVVHCHPAGLSCCCCREGTGSTVILCSSWEGFIAA